MASFSSAPKESAPAMTLRGEDAVAESAMMRLWEVESNYSELKKKVEEIKGLLQSPKI